MENLEGVIHIGIWPQGMSPSSISIIISSDDTQPHSIIIYTLNLIHYGTWVHVHIVIFITFERQNHSFMQGLQILS